MSETPLLDAKTSLKKMTSIIVDINNLNSDYIPKLRMQPEKILEELEKYEDEKNLLLKTIESNTEEINSLKNKISQNQRDYAKGEEDNAELTKNRQEIEVKILESQNELKKTKETIQIKKEELINRDERLKELENQFFALTKEVEKFEENLKTLEKELNGTFRKKEKFVESYENRVAAMKILINKGYISSQLYQFIKALQVGSKLDIRNILMAIDMREEQARTIITKMLEEGAPIDYDQAGGTITLKEEVDF
jgi:chromosome segregation ATPase